MKIFSTFSHQGNVFSISSLWFHVFVLNVELFDLSAIYLGVYEMMDGPILFFKL